MSMIVARPYVDMYQFKCLEDVPIGATRFDIPST